MDFLRCIPTVFVIGNEYEILIWGREKGLFSVRIGDSIFTEKNSGVLNSEKELAKIRVPQSVLNESLSYEVLYRQSIKRRAYYPKLAEEKRAVFEFAPLKKEKKNIRIYHISNVNKEYDRAFASISQFNNDIDLYVFNGDFGEFEIKDDFFNALRFLGDVTHGKVPTVFARGNKDARGRSAELFTEIFPCNDKKLFYTFEVGAINGIVLDCGEDKADDHKDRKGMKKLYARSPLVYGGVNDFHDYREKELEYLRSVNLKKDKIRIAVSHICPCLATLKKGSAFDIERELYDGFTKEIERLNVNLMLCGHMHKPFIAYADDERNIIEHSFPVVFGTCNKKDGVFGSVITLNADDFSVTFTDNAKTNK